MLHTDNTLVLVVDIQERLIPALNNAPDFVQNCAKLLTGLNALGVPAIVTEQYPKGLGATVADIKAVTTESPVFEKTRFSAYTDEVAQAIAQHQNIENIIVIGCETHVCILQTVLDLRARNVNVYLPQECLTSRTEANKQNGLQQCRDAGAVVSNLESVLFQLLGDAKHPVFKTISKLIV